MRKIKTALVVGAGTMGHGFAQLFAVNHIPVFLVDETEEFLTRAKNWIKNNLYYMIELKEIKKSQIRPTLDRINFTTDLKLAAEKTDYVLEAVPENLDMKKNIFQQLDEYTQPEVILSSNTSSFDINELSVVVTHPERIIGTHWYNPPQITPCVEVIPSNATNQETIDSIMDFLKLIGKVPTQCKSSPGFVGNRIQFAMAAEAFAIIEQGLATPGEVDQIVRNSFGFRLGVYGPFEICDQAGSDVYQAIFEYLYTKLKKEQFKPPTILKQFIEQGRLGLKNQKGFYDYKEKTSDMIKQERDRKLYDRLRLLKKEQKV